MKKHGMTILIILMFIVGLSVLLYPAISEYINEKHASRIIADYHTVLDNTGEDELNEMLRKAQDYNRRLAENPAAFFNPASVSGYSETLDLIGIGVMGKISIPKIGVELPIYHTVEPEVLQIGAGHLEGTSLPVGGRDTHCVLSGHRGLPSAKLFTALDRLSVGDTFTINVLNEVLTYEIDQILTVKPDQTDALQIVKGMDYCTLLTCTPYGINTHRLLVRGVRIGTQTEKAGIFVSNEAFKIDPLIVTPIVALPMLLALLLITTLGSKTKSRRKKTAEKEENRKNEKT